ncbi:MAG: DUF6580 family putative transport protein [Rickettsiales bacterium]
MNKERLITLSLIILIAAASRLLPHPANVTPITAIALFAGAHFSKKWLAFAVPVLAMLVSDMVIGFHNTMWAVYLGFALVVALGFVLNSRKGILPVAITTLCASIVFFVVSNLGVWISPLYPTTIEGLVTCFTAAIPFFTNSLFGDAFYVTLLFGGFALAQKRFPILATA